MDGINIAKGLIKDLEFVKPEAQVDVVTRRVSLIDDPIERSAAEAWFLIGRSVRATKDGLHVILLIHGIRTEGVWQDKLYAKLKKSPTTLPVIVGFPYQDVFSFWFPSLFRRYPIERVEREIRNAIKDNPHSHISVVAHSFGTYVISEILTRRPDIQLYRLLLCGSIIDRTYPWDALKNIPTEEVVNDVGTKDILPATARMVSWGYGNSGTFGFRTGKIKDRFFNFGHSDFFTDQHIDDYWIPYLVDGEIVESEWSHERPSPPFWLSITEVVPFKSVILPAFFYLLYLLYSSNFLDKIFSAFNWILNIIF
jgi:pimeloyl-ACP methyl ester carboxylesterase